MRLFCVISSVLKLLFIGLCAERLLMWSLGNFFTKRTTKQQRKRRFRYSTYIRIVQMLIELWSRIHCSFAWLLSVGVSFRMAQRVFLMSTVRTGVATIGNINENKVRSYARMVCAVNLETISTCRQLAWAFALTMDMSTHMATSYLDRRFRVFRNYAIHDMHVLAIPMFTRHTADQIFFHASKALDALDDN